MSNDSAAPADFRQPKHVLLKEKLEVPALRVGDQKIAEHLNARNRLEFLRIDEIGVHRERVGFAEKLHETAVFLDQVVGEHRDTEATLAGAQNAEHVCDGQMRCARALALAADFEEPAPVLQMNR